jgi:hypothetical protein
MKTTNVSDETKHNRRRFLRNAALTVAATKLFPLGYARKYVGRYEHRNLTGGIGHNLPQEAPEAFAKAIIDVDSF